MKTEDKEQYMDILIKKHINQSGLGKYLISPYDDFTQKVMMEIRKIEKDRIMTSRLFIVILSLLPFSVRIIWGYIRGDYFSLAEMPFGQYLATTYHILMTASASLVLFMVGAGIALYLLS